jgi:hypothetical protein
MSEACCLGAVSVILAAIIEALACLRMHALDRLRESTRLAAADGYRRERYRPQLDDTIETVAARKYCEYPSVLIRVVLGNPEVFCR